MSVPTGLKHAVILWTAVEFVNLFWFFRIQKKEKKNKTHTHAKQADIHNSEMFVSKTKLKLLFVVIYNEGFFSSRHNNKEDKSQGSRVHLALFNNRIYEF